MSERKQTVNDQKYQSDGESKEFSTPILGKIVASSEGCSCFLDLLGCGQKYYAPNVQFAFYPQGSLKLIFHVKTDF